VKGESGEVAYDADADNNSNNNNNNNNGNTTPNVSGYINLNTF
jgi:hypothetical protein